MPPDRPPDTSTRNGSCDQQNHELKSVGMRVKVCREKSDYFEEIGTVTDLMKVYLWLDLDFSGRARVMRTSCRPLCKDDDGQNSFSRHTADRECSIMNNKEQQKSRSKNSKCSESFKSTPILKNIRDEETRFRLPDYEKGGDYVGDDRIATISLVQTIQDQEACSFFKHVVGGRMIQIPRKVGDLIPKRLRLVGDNVYELVLTKLEEKRGLYQTAKQVQCIYIQIEGPNVKTICPKAVLEGIADFSVLSPRKARARLELLTSPAYKVPKTCENLIYELEPSNFCDIDEKGHVGCGFICEMLLAEINRKAVCIQTRLFIRSMGIYKGMLMKKRITSGPKILLPGSMKKVAASKMNTSEDACLLINSAGIDPSKNNLLMGRMSSINPDLDNPPPKSFKPKELDAMTIYLFRAWGVPGNVLQRYQEKCLNYQQRGKRTEGEKYIFEPFHGSLRGVADPTGKIPSNFVFIPGVHNNNLLSDRIFITRQPVMVKADGCIVQVLRSKPESMTKEEYEWLLKLPFGEVVFGFPEKGMQSMPELIADSDLDGDRFFLCWEKEILKHIKAEVLGNVPIVKEEPSTINEPINYEAHEDWFSELQECLIDPSDWEIEELMRKLYSLSKKEMKEDKERLMENPDAFSFGKGYKQALKHSKHGTQIQIPSHLWKKVPKKYRKYISDV